MKKQTLILFILILSFTTAHGQANYQTAIGFRGGLSNGVTIKHFVNSSDALEGIIAFRWAGYHATALYEKHQSVFDEPGFNLYYGAGGHIGFWNGLNNPWFNDDQEYTVIGADAIFGLEYTFEDAPINLSIDWKPAINIIGDQSFWGDAGGVSVRFVF